MLRRFLGSGVAEGFKAGCHGVALVGAGSFTVYNGAAFVARGRPRQWHLLVNAVLYGALTLWEGTHVVHHLQR